MSKRLPTFSKFTSEPTDGKEADLAIAHLEMIKPGYQLPLTAYMLSIMRTWIYLCYLETDERVPYRGLS